MWKIYVFPLIQYLQNRGKKLNYCFMLIFIMFLEEKEEEKEKKKTHNTLPDSSEENVSSMGLSLSSF